MNISIKKLNLTLDSENNNIVDVFKQKKKENEMDVNSLPKNPIDRLDPEEFKKYSETYSPYPFFLFAYINWASDLKILAMPTWDSLVQFKIDWIWSNEFSFNREKHILYINSIKNWLIKWSWNATPENQRIPQDWKGVLHLLNENKELVNTIQLRAAFVPQHLTDFTQNPLETAVIRLLGWEKKLLLENSWFNSFDYEKIISLKYMKKWLILISWPTWSWKSTTLFSFINQLNDWTKNIYTLENPVEFDVPWITQIDINPIEDISDSDEITNNFERGKKFLMRWAWDVILIWEIRDYVTALAAVQMGDTWHITLWTLHTKSAIDTISRYLWFESWGKNSKNIDRTVLIELLQYVSAQMLPPKLCKHCKVKVSKIRKELIEKSNLDIENKEKLINNKEYKIKKHLFLSDAFYKIYSDMIRELDIQKDVIKKEFTKNNIKKIFNFDDKTLDYLIENSCFPNLHWCEKCNINKNTDFINPRSWYKWVQMINESLIFDSYITDLLLDKNFNKKSFLDNLLMKRPILKKWENWYIKERKNNFFTMYQDALFKALLPEKNLKNVMTKITDNNLISLLDAKIHWYIEV